MIDKFTTVSALAPDEVTETAALRSEIVWLDSFKWEEEVMCCLHWKLNR